MVFRAERDGGRFEARLAGVGRWFAPRGDTFERFVCERYAIYGSDGGRVYRTDSHHSALRVRRARVEIAATTLVSLPLEGVPHALLGGSQDTLRWPLEEL